MQQVDGIPSGEIGAGENHNAMSYFLGRKQEPSGRKQPGNAFDCSPESRVALKKMPSLTRGEVFFVDKAS
jgi:hypothetical protein